MVGKADIHNPLSLLAHERSRFATCQWELLTPTDISIPLTHRLVLYALEAGECLFCVHDMRILGRIVGVRSTEQFVWHLLPPGIIITMYEQKLSLWQLPQAHA